LDRVWPVHDQQDWWQTRADIRRRGRTFDAWRARTVRALQRYVYCQYTSNHFDQAGVDVAWVAPRWVRRRYGRYHLASNLKVTVDDGSRYALDHRNGVECALVIEGWPKPVVRLCLTYVVCLTAEDVVHGFLDAHRRDWTRGPDVVQSPAGL